MLGDLVGLNGDLWLVILSPVSRRTILQAFRLEWVKSIACTVSIHLYWRAESRCSISAVAVSCFSCSVVVAYGVSLPYISFGGLLVYAV